MGLCMKTTVEIDEDLLRRSKEAGLREGRSLRSLIEEGLRNLLELRERHERGEHVRVELPVSSVRGGLQPGVNLNDSARLEDLMNS